MKHLLCLLTCFLVCSSGSVGETLGPLKGAKAPQAVEELWAEYDSTKEPLEVKVVRQWEEDGITCRYITYTIGTFNGSKSTMAAFYGFGTDHKGKLPALIQMHGGGQRAAIHSIKYGAENGYATLSINWGGRPMEKAEPGDPGTARHAVSRRESRGECPA